jgi:hypothetical protein
MPPVRAPVVVADVSPPAPRQFGSKRLLAVVVVLLVTSSGVAGGWLLSQRNATSRFARSGDAIGEANAGAPPAVQDAAAGATVSAPVVGVSVLAVWRDQSQDWAVTVTAAQDASNVSVSPTDFYLLSGTRHIPTQYSGTAVVLNAGEQVSFAVGPEPFSGTGDTLVYAPELDGLVARWKHAV